VKTALVIGAGLVGASCALALQRAGLRTTLLDAGEPTRAASWGNAGHLAIEQVAPLASWANLRSLPRRLTCFGGPVALPLRDWSAWLPFGLRLLKASSPGPYQHGEKALSALLGMAMPAWRRLAADIGVPTAVREDGHFVVWETAASAQAGQRHWQQTNIGEAAAQPANAQDLAYLRERFNGLPAGAMRFKHTGQVLDLAQTRGALVRTLCDRGGALQMGHATSVTVKDGGANVQLQDGQSLSADWLVVAAGVGSAKLLRDTHGPVPLIAERGYHVESAVNAAQWPHDMPPVAFEDRSVIVTRFASTLRIAGFTEFSRAESAPDPRKWQRLEHHAKALGLPCAQGGSHWLGARPTLPDYLPAIGRSQVAGNLLYAFGHQHLGVTLAAATGELLAALPQCAAPAVSLAPFNLQRFH
jgi:D-hydroxyproline dehydrogenase